ncbi:simple sugar transport system permease protein [Allostreptomyces psammosilenae]|uniref:Simple sugar transport system permease protein n=1 Tax=Allostreptomyces psammosilenae TaxID=1892865 RepID=A0A853A0V1_9ACTN|nr:simple sugar transport system permease protein [Allostreptomyces psammosilenae]
MTNLDNRPAAAAARPRPRLDLGRLGLALAAPVLAIVFAVLLTSVVLLVSGEPAFSAYPLMVSYGFEPDSIVYILNRGTTYYLAALAVALGFRMNLFNIGVDGQYRLAAMLAASVGGALALPMALHLIVIIVVAVLVGAAWAGIAGLLKVTRGVSEVISSIMLNTIATGLIAYLLTPELLGVRPEGSNNITTQPLPGSAWFPWFPTPGGDVWGFIVVAALAGVAYHLVLNRTRFGFDLRAAGHSESAAVASGVNVKRMVMTSMLVSGGIAGLIGMPQLLNGSHQYGLDFPTGIGFTGIAIALLGRNHPLGIAFGALLWAFLDRSGSVLDSEGYPNEITTIMQGTIVVAVVIAYELVRRYGLARQQRIVGAQLRADARAAGSAPAGADDPGKADNPGKAEEPAKADEPIKAEEPAKPAEAEEPAKADGTEKPAEADEAAEPATAQKPAKTEKPSGDDSAAPTEDDSSDGEGTR